MTATHDLFTQLYGKKYTNKIEHLKKRLTVYVTGEDQFIVLPFEAGLGKSIQSDRIIGEYLARNTDHQSRRFLIVKRFVEDVEASVRRINESCSSDIALGITAANWNDFKSDLDRLVRYPVLIITHERYVRLANNEYERGFFTRGRHTLILDEALNQSIVSFSEETMKRIQAILPFSLQRSLLDVCNGLFAELTNQKKSNNSLERCRPSTDREALSKFKGEVNANLHLFTPPQKEELRKFVHTLEILYSGQCLYNLGTLSGVDRSFERWGLRNNIILDANGSLDRQYRYDPFVTIDRQTPIIDHSTTTLYQVDFNASKNNISKSKDFFEKIGHLITERKKESDKTLVVTQKQHLHAVEKCLEGVEGISVAYFGDIIGKNDWRDYTQVWVIANPLYRMETYPLRWSMASHKPLNRHHLTLIPEKGKLRFKNKDFEQIRFGCVVSEIYQAVKRINRDNTKEAEMYVLTSDDNVIKELQSHLKGVRIGETINFDVERKNEAQPKRKTQGELIAAHLQRMQPGEYDKSEIREELGMEKSNFARSLKDASVKDLELANRVKISTRKIQVLDGA